MVVKRNNDIFFIKFVNHVSSNERREGLRVLQAKVNKSG